MMEIGTNIIRQTALPSPRGRRGLLFQREEGNALTELAFILPIFLALITGIGTFVIAFANQQTLIHATSIGAETLQGIRTTTSDPCADH